MRSTTAPSIHRASPSTAPGNAGGGGEKVALHPPVAGLRPLREPGEANPGAAVDERELAVELHR